MSTAPQVVARQRWARAPFYFNSAANLLRISREKASNLQELLDAVRSCSDACIFQHTFQTLEEHHFIREGFSNDFSHWAFASCNEVELAERLAGLDVREFTSIAALRERERTETQAKVVGDAWLVQRQKQLSHTQKSHRRDRHCLTCTFGGRAAPSYWPGEPFARAKVPLG